MKNPALYTTDPRYVPHMKNETAIVMTTVRISTDIIQLDSILVHIATMRRIAGRRLDGSNHSRTTRPLLFLNLSAEGGGDSLIRRRSHILSGTIANIFLGSTRISPFYKRWMLHDRISFLVPRRQILHNSGNLAPHLRCFRRQWMCDLFTVLISPRLWTPTFSFRHQTNSCMHLPHTHTATAH